MDKLTINNSSRINELRNSDQKEIAERRAKNEARNNARSESDNVEFSNRASEARKLSSYVNKLPDTRSERVEHFQNLVNSKSYKPASADIADALLREEI